VLEEAWNLLSDEAKPIFRIAESNLDALNTVDLDLERPFSVSEGALRARFTGPRFAGKVAAVVGLVHTLENPYPKSRPEICHYNQQLTAAQERRPERGRGHIVSWIGLGEQPCFLERARGRPRLVEQRYPTP
jgi:hypothetical protein